MQLVRMATREKPDLTLSHGSRSQLICSYLLRIPSLAIYDYEHTAGVGFVRPDWVFSPHYIPESQDPDERNREMKYPGLKEDVYVPQFHANPKLRHQLGLSADDIIVTVRPPANEAHYHNPEAEVLFDAAMNMFNQQADVRVILLPRNNKQCAGLRKKWSEWIDRRKIVIPERAVNGLNLIWCSDLVISGGGTMNREAAALGVPVYSIFRGRMGAVDQYLASAGRMVLLETVEDVRTKIILKRRQPEDWGRTEHNDVLPFIVDGIVSILENQRLPVRQ